MIYNSRIQIRRLAHFSCTNSMQLFLHRVPIFKITDSSRRDITHWIKCLFSNCNLYHFIFLEPRLICWRSSHFFTPCVGPYFQHSMLSMNEVFGFLILFLRGVKDAWFLNSEDNNLSSYEKVACNKEAEIILRRFVPDLATSMPLLTRTSIQRQYKHTTSY